MQSIGDAVRSLVDIGGGELGAAHVEVFAVRIVIETGIEQRGDRVLFTTSPRLVPGHRRTIFRYVARMGFLKKLKDLGGAPSKELLQNGVLGRGVIVGVEATRVATGPEGFEKRVCVVTLEIALDNTPVYQASVRHAFSPLDMAQLVPGQSVVAVRVNPEDPQESHSISPRRLLRSRSRAKARAQPMCSRGDLRFAP